MRATKISNTDHFKLQKYFLHRYKRKISISAVNIISLRIKKQTDAKFKNVLL